MGPAIVDSFEKTPCDYGPNCVISFTIRPTGNVILYDINGQSFGRFAGNGTVTALMFSTNTDPNGSGMLYATLRSGGSQWVGRRVYVSLELGMMGAGPTYALTGMFPA